MSKQSNETSSSRSNGEATGKPVPIATGLDHPIRSLRNELNHVFDRFFQPAGLEQTKDPSFLDYDPFKFWAPLRMSGLEPSADVEETDKSYEISVELPGIDEKEIDLTLNDGVLTLKGEKKTKREEKKKDYHLMERSFGSFRRSFRVPSDVDDKKVSADFSKGVLKVTLLKSDKAKAKHRKIGIKSK